MAELRERYASALVTGGSSGLGRVLAETLAAEGLTVWATSRQPSKIVWPHNVQGVALDLADPQAAARFWQNPPWENPPAILVNNAGFGVFSPVADIAQHETEEQLAVMLAGPMEMCRQFLALKNTAPRRAIVNVASLAGEFPLPFMAAYNAAKAGLSTFSRSLMLEYPQHGSLCVIDLRPGDFQTAFNDNARRQESQSEPVRRAWQSLEKHLKAGAEPSQLARDTLRALTRGRHAVVRSGTFFQAKCGPALARLAPDSLVRAFLRLYYGL